MVSVPPSGMTSRAFNARFRSAFSSCCASVIAYSGPAIGAAIRLMWAGSVRLSKIMVSLTRSVMFTDTDVSGCLRENASKRLINEAPRREALRAGTTYSAIWGSCG